MNDDNKKAKKKLEQLLDYIQGKSPIDIPPDEFKSDVRYAVVAVDTTTGQFALAMETAARVCDESECERIMKTMQADYPNSADIFIMPFIQAITALMAEDTLRRKVANVTDSESTKAIIN